MLHLNVLKQLVEQWRDGWTHAIWGIYKPWGASGFVRAAIMLTVSYPSAIWGPKVLHARACKLIQKLGSNWFCDWGLGGCEWSWNDRLSVCFAYWALHVIRVEINMLSEVFSFSQFFCNLAKVMDSERTWNPSPQCAICCYWQHTCNFNSYTKLA